MDNYVMSYVIDIWGASPKLAVHFARIYTGIVQSDHINRAWQAFICGYTGIDLIPFDSEILSYYQLGLAYAQRN